MTPPSNSRNDTLLVLSMSAIFAFSGSLHAEQVSVLVSPSENFTIVNTGASTPGSTSVSVIYSSAALTTGHRLKISVKASGPNFTSSKGDGIPANKVSWTVSSASGGSASAGTLSSSSWTQVFLSNTNPTSGSIALNFNLVAPGSESKAGTQTMQLDWQFSSQ